MASTPTPPQTPYLALLAELANVPITEAITPPDLTTQALSLPPFVSPETVPGAFNLRDVGGLVPRLIAPGRVYRSGAPDTITPEGRVALRSQLGIRCVYDLRRRDELGQASSPSDDDGGPERIHCPFNMNVEGGPPVPMPAVITTFAPLADGSPGPGYVTMHDEIMGGYKAGYRKVFEGIRDSADGQAVLFHCTAGRDRTGLLAAMILELMGADAATIGFDYSLSRIGLEPFRKTMMPKAIMNFVPEAVRGFLKAGTLPPGLKEFFTTDPQTMIRFVERFRQQYGGTEGYLQQILGFDENDIKTIRRRLAPVA
ncbi:protein-tyrosine phosphatase-like protein [Lasiosphaeria miniovina]|uniref:Protein-tyrosine phosphatase-like protein n=1 Tax=Lasiosphaeria miniovina TaxID=1954250 RepID=A0AA40AKK6_9PEZI|nr:protein-tyrosine phosphatase-like protein [Lasiosphaeria miniovina]KAK0717492.1 protein-tyrosine phosphatase-like protein [Lasiosphaeria miniovina]